MTLSPQYKRFQAKQRKEKRVRQSTVRKVQNQETKGQNTYFIVYNVM